MFFYTRNLTTLSTSSDVLPWDFKPKGEISQQIRHDKKARQDWYQGADTAHYFYTTLEGSNPNMRPSKDNPPRAIHSLAADYDLRIPEARVNEAIATMKIKPAWVERSLGGNVRLVWLFPRPLMTDTYDFTMFVLEKAIKWLNLDLLPGLDESAFTSPTRLLCNGCDWKATGHGPVDENELQAFFVSCGKSFRFKGAETSVPLELVEAELRKVFPAFNWPNEFLPDTQGPTFWIPESVSPLSAILKPEGFITFSAHAVKPFYSWADILGPEFIRKFSVDSIAKATNDIWWDGKKFWKKKGENYVSVEMTELNNYFQVQCKLSNKAADGGGPSPAATALDHIYNENYVIGAASFVCRQPGLIDFMGKRVLNTYVNRAMKPFPEPVVAWGDRFPFLASLLDNLFSPSMQLPFFLAWWKHFYTAAITNLPMPGQNTYLMGGADVGKTLLNRVVIGLSVGGHVDASDFLIRGAQFNSELFESPLWCVDDESAGESEATRNNFSAMLKKSTANSTFRYNKKFEVSVMVEWMGRVLCTTNLDYVSSRLLGSMDNTSQDKTNLFKCTTESKIVFPTRYELEKIIRTELPFILRWLLDWTPPECVKRHVRFGYKSYQEETLLDKSYQGSRSAPFKEILIESLQQWFSDNKTEKEWKGTVTQVIRLMHTNPLNEMVIRALRIEQTSRYLESIERENLIPCRAETGDMKQRIWVFSRI